MNKLAWTCALAVAATVFVPQDASARRRIVGGEELKDEDKADEKEAEAARKKREAAEKKKAEEDKKRAAARKKKEAEQAKAEEAARKAAEAARKKKKEDEERKSQAVIEAEKKRLEDNQAGRLQEAKKSRRISRASGSYTVVTTIEPGSVRPNKLSELRFDVAEKLKVASARYGNLKPLKGARLVASIAPPDTGGGEEPVRYRVHELKTPGAYGIHLTPTLEGAHTVVVEGTTKSGQKIRAQFALHVGTWPPPDFEAEEANNKEFAASGSGRRVAGGR